MGERSLTSGQKKTLHTVSIVLVLFGPWLVAELWQRFDHLVIVSFTSVLAFIVGIGFIWLYIAILGFFTHLLERLGSPPFDG